MRVVVGQASLALLALAAASCSTSSAPACSGGGPASAVVASTDERYATNELGTVSLGGCSAFYQVNFNDSEDPMLASSAGRVFLIGRLADQVIEIDPHDTSVVHGPWTANPDLDAGQSNPQDVAVDPTTGNVWVARFNVPSILVKTYDGQNVVGSIDLSNVTGVSRNPNMASIRIIDLGRGPKAYVSLEMLDEQLEATGPSYLARLDVATAVETGKVEALLELKGRNPFGLMVEQGTSLYLADFGHYDASAETNAGIERVDLTTFTSELIATEEAIGAKVDQVSVSGHCATAIVFAHPLPNVTSLVSVDLEAGAIATSYDAGFLTTDAGFELAGMAWVDGGVNLVGDRTGVPGKGYAIHRLTTSPSCAVTESQPPLYVPLGPVAIQPVP